MNMFIVYHTAYTPDRPPPERNPSTCSHLCIPRKWGTRARGRWCLNKSLKNKKNSNIHITTRVIFNYVPLSRIFPYSARLWRIPVITFRFRPSDDEFGSGILCSLFAHRTHDRSGAVFRSAPPPPPPPSRQTDENRFRLRTDIMRRLGDEFECVYIYYVILKRYFILRGQTTYRISRRSVRQRRSRR